VAAALDDEDGPHLAAVQEHPAVIGSLQLKPLGGPQAPPKPQSLNGLRHAPQLSQRWIVDGPSSVWYASSVEVELITHLDTNS
jgi:hypothetical protein